MADGSLGAVDLPHSFLRARTEFGGTEVHGLLTTAPWKTVLVASNCTNDRSAMSLSDITHANLTSSAGPLRPELRAEHDRSP